MNDRTLQRLLAMRLREWLFRQGFNVAHLSDDQLLTKIRYTFTRRNC